MTRVLLVFDPAEPAQASEVDSLRVNAPAGFEAIPAPVIAGADTIEAERPDAVLVYAPGPVAAARNLMRARGWSAPLFARWIPMWPRDLDALHETLRQVDGVLFAHPTYWERLGRLPGTASVPPGVALGPGMPTSRPDRILWIGSRLPSDWGSLEAPERRLRIMSDILGVEIDVLPAERASDHLHDPNALGPWLETGTIAVCAAARPEAPHVAAMAVAAGCAVVTVPEADPFGFIEHDRNGYVAERNHAAVLDGLKAAIAERGRWAVAGAERLASWSWPTRAEALFAALPSLGQGTRAAASRIDLTDSVTVFVTTVGAPSLDACLHHIDCQDSRFRFELIAGVAPMSKAFQAMLDRCTTPLYVQVDEDMLLYPWAIRALHESIQAAASDVALVVAMLHDAHIDRLIQGVKIFRHDVVRRYPLFDTGNFELDQIDRLAADGFRYVVLPGTAPMAGEAGHGGPFGLHGTHWTARSVYERYFTLKEAHRVRPRAQKWLEECAPMLLRRFLEEGSDLDFYALMAIVGATVAGRESVRAKDFRRYGDLAGMRELEGFLRSLRRPARNDVAPTPSEPEDGPPR